MEEESQTLAETEDATEEEPADTSDSNLPLLLTIIAVFVWFGFQTVQLVRERMSLGEIKSNQELALQQSQKVRMHFETILNKTAELAEKGNPGARFVMEELQKRGVTYAPPPGSKPPK